MNQHILQAFGLDQDHYHAEAFGSGLINHTWMVTGADGAYILQRINISIFKSPQAIADNLALLAKYFKATAPGYLFPAPLAAADGKYMVEANGAYYRLLPFVTNSHTINAVKHGKQAYEAAQQFGKFSRLLNGFNTKQLHYTLPNFHNLSLRVQQFKSALQQAKPERLSQVTREVTAVQDNLAIAHTYQKLVAERQIPLRAVHHDTKISNVLFDDHDNGLCVIDLDTVMPGYYLSDVGDMMRTYLSPANEEERSLDKVQINTRYFAEIYNGYMSQMGDVLSGLEKSLFIYSGKLMIYMQAVRFLTDFLNGDIYYQTQYPGHNLARAQNQLTLLNRYLQSEAAFQDIITAA